ncbi:MAG TPA: protease pro-enzyme activation domain-containing protein, partial [Acidimicrobiales bacterium]|nr:protease pro-enzyme activation domain-containing protein [Acidimicrobiales bacterium]
MRFTRQSRRLAVVAAASLTAAPFLVGPAPVAAATGHASTTGAGSLATVVPAPGIPVGARALGAVSPTATITGAIVLQPRDNAAVQAFIAAATDPKSASFHHYLGAGAFGARFGPTAATVASAESALRGGGLRITAVTDGGLFVRFTGTASAAEAAFHTGIERYRLANGTYGQGTTGPVRLPAGLASNVTAVVGLDDLVHAVPLGIHHDAGRASRYPAAKAPASAGRGGAGGSGGVGPVACSDATQAAVSLGGLTDDQIMHAYGADGLYNQGDNGSGQTIAVFELE